jgi:hypothetical protein
MNLARFFLTTMLAIAISPIQAQDAHPSSICRADQRRGCIQGSVGDEFGTPLRGIIVEVLPAEKVGDERWDHRESAWTDSYGNYSVGHIMPGEYLIAVHYYNAPDARRPFPTTFYPGVDAEGGAERIPVREGSPVLLKQLRLHKLRLMRITVDVLFEDGSKPESSSLLLHNPKYPNQAVIGDESLAVVGGFGEFEIPTGFSYIARAAVQCDGGSKIETRESRPVQEINAESDGAIRLKLTIPGPACHLWRPK